MGAAEVETGVPTQTETETQTQTKAKASTDSVEPRQGAEVPYQGVHSPHPVRGPEIWV